jgi:CBS domain-containing protein
MSPPHLSATARQGGPDPLAISAHASPRAALYALSPAGTTRLLVRRKPDRLPEGVITHFDLALAARR